jgi:hypothetical protein
VVPPYSQYCADRALVLVGGGSDVDCGCESAYLLPVGGCRCRSRLLSLLGGGLLGLLLFLPWWAGMWCWVAMKLSSLKMDGGVRWVELLPEASDSGTTLDSILTSPPLAYPTNRFMQYVSQHEKGFANDAVESDANNCCCKARVKLPTFEKYNRSTRSWECLPHYT